MYAPSDFLPLRGDICKTYNGQTDSYYGQNIYTTKNKYYYIVAVIYKKLLYCICCKLFDYKYLYFQTFTYISACNGRFEFKVF